VHTANSNTKYTEQRRNRLPVIVLKANKLNKYFREPDEFAIKDVSFEVKKGNLFPL